MKDRIFKGFIYSLILAALVFAGLGIYADFNELLQSIVKFPKEVILVVILLSLMNYLTRFIRWQFYLKRSGIEIPMSLSTYTFFSGLFMSVTPGKAGEILKSLILKEAEKIPISKTAPVVFAERLTDLIAVIILVISFSFSFQLDWRIVAVGILMVASLFAFFLSEAAFRVISRIFSSFERLEKFLGSIKSLFKGVKDLLGFKPVFAGVLFGVLAWLFEGLAFYLLLATFDRSISPYLSVFIYTISTLAGAISMLPGGLVFTEATMSGILVASGFQKHAAVACTVLIRALTLWFGSALGLVVFFLFKPGFLKGELNGR